MKALISNDDGITASGILAAKKAVDELHEMLEDEEGPTAAFVEAVKKNVVDWVINHIKSFDCSVATYIHMNAHPERI